jgi:uncharacterized protein
MPFNLFRKKKQPEQETPAVPPQEEPKQEAPPQSPEETPVAPVQEKIEEATALVQESSQEPVPAPAEQKQEPAQPLPEEKAPAPEPPSKTYLKAMPLRELSDLEGIKTEVKNGNIIILRVTPLAGKSIEDVKTAVNDLYQFAESISGDIARLGEERVVICPKTIRIWREKSPAPVGSEPLPATA